MNRKEKGTTLFIVLSGFFICNAVLAEFIGVKLFSLENTIGIAPLNLLILGNRFSFNLTAGVLLWPFVFIFTDIINEYYGQKGVRFISILTACLISYAFIIVYFVIKLSPAPFWITSKESSGIEDMNLAFSQIFGQGLGIIIGSLIAFLFGQIIDVIIFHKIKKITGEKFIWLRSTGSTLISQFIDSFVVLFFAFYLYPRLTNVPETQFWSFGLVLSICIGNYIYKFLLAIGLTPFLYIVHWGVEEFLGKKLAFEMKQNALKN
jgi:uncharacterized integral membrane protein (TIGR00697 family)